MKTNTFYTAHPSFHPLVDAAARRSRRWFQGKAAARTAFV
jgi:hypothetical protein